MDDETPGNAELRAELNAALAVLNPQIRGLEDLCNVSISDALKVEVKKELEVCRRRQACIQAVLDGLNATLAAIVALHNDGYPYMPDPRAAIGPQLFEELEVQNRDINVAAALFVPETSSTISIDLGPPVAKP